MNSPRRSTNWTPKQKVMPDDHSKLAPLLPISNRTVKRLCADDSAGSRVKVGHCQALTAVNAQSCDWAFSLPFRRQTTTRLLQKWKENASRFSAAKAVLQFKASLIAASPARKSNFLQIFKNIQPISVGVWRQLPSSLELVHSTTNAHEEKKWSSLWFFNLWVARKSKKIKIEL